MPRWAAPVALVVAVVALALATWGLLSESSNPPATALAGDPKTRVCTAFETVSKAVPLQTNNDLGPGPVAQTAVAANARLALFGGGQYLLNSLDSATPEKLADAVRLFATNLQDIGMKLLVGTPNTDPALSEQLKAAQATSAHITDLCK